MMNRLMILSCCMAVMASLLVPSSASAMTQETLGKMLNFELLREVPIEMLAPDKLPKNPFFDIFLTGEISEKFNKLGEAENAVRLYAVEYITTDVDGKPTKASGLVMIPVVQGAHPWLSYQQGTIFNPEDCPSNPERSIETILVMHIFAAHGYLVSMPDYLGQGRSMLRHPYMHSATEGSSAMHMLEATRQLCARLQVELNGKLFLAGLSQGGQATMALHRLLESGGASVSPVTASAPISGLYRIYPCWNLWMEQGDPFVPVLMAKLIVSSYYLYGVCDPLKDVFLSPYDKTVEELLFGRRYSAEEVISGLPPDPRLLIKEEFLKAMRNGTHPIIKFMNENDVYDWRPNAPLHLCYGALDMLVPPEMAGFAKDQMCKLGAADVEIVNLGAYSHSGTLLPGLLYAKEWFDSLK